MKILFDHGTPAPLRHHLTEHLVDLAEGKGDFRKWRIDPKGRRDRISRHCDYRQEHAISTESKR